jgi:heptosyltransferase-2
MPKKRALIVKFGQIGDVVMALPAAWALHQQGYAIHWVCGRAARPLLDCYSWVHVIPVDDKAILRGKLPARLAEAARFWSRCGLRRNDLCATLYFDRRFHWLTALFRARRKVSLSRQRRAATLLPGRHHTDEYMRVLLDQQDGCRDRSAAPVRPDRLPPLSLIGIAAATRVAIVPGGTSNVLGEQTLRRWPIANYVALAQLLLGRGCEVVLLGGPEDAWVKPHFSQLAVTDMVGALALPEVISVCDTCDAVITHDTGPLHLAGLSSACIVGIFGPVDPSTRVPRRSGVVGIWGGQGFACRPCYDGRDFAPCQFNGCMHQVSPELVLRELDRLLAARASGQDRPWHIVSPEASSLASMQQSSQR